MANSAGGAVWKTLIIVLAICGAMVLLCVGSGLLLTYVNSPIVATRSVPTSQTIQEISIALEAFRADWGQYPPSSIQPDDGTRKYGSECLAYYLMGPQGKGWGRAPGTGAPFGGETTGYYPPYFVPDMCGGPGDSIIDAFPPAKPILYFRCQVTQDPPYDVRNNPLDPSCIDGFASQEHFELLVRPKDSKGNRGWVRQDYLLISSGPDRLFGYVVVEDAPTGKVRPATPEEVEGGEAECDDVTNFRR